MDNQFTEVELAYAAYLDVREQYWYGECELLALSLAYCEWMRVVDSMDWDDCV